MEDLLRNLRSQELDPAPRVRLLADVLRVPPDNPELRQALKELDGTDAVRELEGEQWPDGSWGRMHSQDTIAPRQKIRTTEQGVARALALGLPVTHPILERAADFLVCVLSSGECPDPEEQNERWPTGVELFAAATLARIQPRHPLLDTVFAKWQEIAARAFPACNGHLLAYDPQGELAAHRELTGIRGDLRYLRMNNRYTLTLLSSRPGSLPAALVDGMLAWIWTLPEGVGYYSVPLREPAGLVQSGPFERWMCSLELLSRFPRFPGPLAPAVDWLREQRRPDGYWDLGKYDPQGSVLPLSASWKDPAHRLVDWSVRVAAIIACVER